MRESEEIMIPFNKATISGKEEEYIQQVISSGDTSSGGIFTDKCLDYLKFHYGFKNPYLTTSCTSALEMAALLIDIRPGDEVILPSFTFVSTANAFKLRGAQLIFVDSKKSHPNIDENLVEELITIRTKAIVVVHYAGVACEMEKLDAICKRHNLFLIEDAAQAIDGHYKNKSLGTLSDISTFSFHATKNINCGEGGCINIQNPSLFTKAETIAQMGTNRLAFLSKKVDYYQWVSLGYSIMPSEINAAMLFAQLENLETIQRKRVELWNAYYSRLNRLSIPIEVPIIPDNSSNNAHIFYILLESEEVRSELISFLHTEKIQAQFHYRSLHKSEYFKNYHDERLLNNSDRFSNCLLRLPLFNDLKLDDIRRVVHSVERFFSRNGN